MLKKTLLTALLSFCALICTAQAADSKALVIELRNGSTTTFVLAEKPEIYFNGHMLRVTMNSRNTEFEISNVSQYYFALMPSMIETPETASLSMTYHSDDKVIVEGLDKQDHIRLYSTSGIQYTDRVKVNGNCAEVSLAALPTGTYIISILNKQSFKVHKK